MTRTRAGSCRLAAGPSAPAQVEAVPIRQVRRTGDPDHLGLHIARTWPDVWHTPCGHVRLTAELLAEAAPLAAELRTHAQAAKVPRPRTPKDEHR